MTTDLLEERLQNLAIDSPDAGRVAARVLARGARPRPRRPPRAIAVGLATVALLTLVAYLAPAADTAFADVPFAGDLLRDAGLVAVSGRVTSVGAEATSSGYRLKLVGAYADSTRTVMLLKTNPVVMPVNAELTDQFGRSYSYQGGSSDLRNGDTSMQFEALAWPDGITGARLTLHVTGVQIVDTTVGPVQTIAGSWTLPATLGVDQGTPLRLPADADLGPAHFHFTAVSYTPATIAVEMTVTGVSPDELSRTVPDGGKGAPALNILLLDPNGQIIDGSGGTTNDAFGATHIQELGFRTEGGGGSYVLRVSYYGEGQFERVLVVP